MSRGIGRRLGSDPVLLCLWCRPAATALIHPLAWEPPYAEGAALKRQKGKNKQTNKQTNKSCKLFINLSCHFCIFSQSIYHHQTYYVFHVSTFLSIYIYFVIPIYPPTIYLPSLFVLQLDCALGKQGFGSPLCCQGLEHCC